MKRQRRDGGAGAAENTVTKAIRPVRMALAFIRISDINILSKYIHPETFGYSPCSAQGNNSGYTQKK